jgi:glutathione synthase/RimK-type ligase-like ATP-grasp enzyme
VEFLERADYGRLLEFDALFIRETTAVNHHTYRFARRAAQDDLVVIDDPQSILRCTNKVWLAQRMTRAGVPLRCDLFRPPSEKGDQLSLF